jgi:hypothetical protein
LNLIPSRKEYKDMPVVRFLENVANGESKKGIRKLEVFFTGSLGSGNGSLHRWGLQITGERRRDIGTKLSVNILRDALFRENWGCMRVGRHVCNEIIQEVLFHRERPSGNFDSLCRLAYLIGKVLLEQSRIYGCAHENDLERPPFGLAVCQ